MRARQITVRVAAALVVLFVAIQLVPYGHVRTTYPTVGEPSWDSAWTREATVRACYDCHSGATRWPWYSWVAPMSWLVRSHVEEGRAVLDFTRWTGPDEESDEAPETVLEQEMPPLYYRILHPPARLTEEERVRLAEGLRATLGTSGAAHSE